MMPHAVPSSVPPVDEPSAAYERIDCENIRFRTEENIMTEPLQKKCEDEEPDYKTTKRKTDEEKTHTRNLSAHFFEATRLSDNVREDNFSQYPLQQPRNDGMRGRFATTNSSTQRHEDPTEASVGHKHRRGFSGDVSNPSMAHRRINSIGNSTRVDRSYDYYGGTTFTNTKDRFPAGVHRREDSAGLDILSAAVDASKEEVDFAADVRRSPWEPPDSTTQNRNRDGGPRSSPSTVSATSYDYNRGQPPYAHPPMRYHHPAGISPTAAYPPYSPFYPHGGSPPFHHASGRSPYPVQHAPDPYLAKHPYDHPAVTHSSSLDSSTRHEPPDERLFERRQPANPRASPTWGKTTTGVQTFVTAIGEGNRTVHPTHRNASTNTEPTDPPIPATVGHHRKLSSYSSLGTLMGPGLFAEPEQTGGHHRSTSSISFLQGLDDAGDIFLQNLNGPSVQASFSPPTRQSEPPAPVVSNNQTRTLAPGGTSKRIRRKCTVDGCPNRVVQGGLCISHGAKRKTCKFPGCSKNVKKAGLCSTHGPARKRCEAEGCKKVAVQGGRCIAHGAKKKLCSMENCSKQAILAGMCKKHHDQTQGILVARGDEDDHKQAPSPPPVCVVIKDKPGGHTRGLSIFQEMSADAVQDILSDPGGNQGHPLRQDGARYY